MDRGRWVMKIFGKAMMIIGLIVFLIGAGGMDSPSLFAPIVMVLAGMGLIFAGNKIDEEWV